MGINEPDNLIVWMQTWFASQVNGEWEHAGGIVIETLDNPGWKVQVDLNETSYESRQLEEIRFDNGEADWATIRFKEGVFEAFVSVKNLGFALRAFQRFVTEE